MFPEFVLRLPPWLLQYIEDAHMVYETAEDRMRLAIELSKLNTLHGTGGPFGAAVFDIEARKLVAPGVNLVLYANCSVLHAEIVALVLAQQMVSCYDLGADPCRPLELVSSTEPCAMCLGAIPWSGVRRLVCGAREEDARRVGFEEGAKLPHWVQTLQERHVQVVQDVLRREAADVLRSYVENDGLVYNSRVQALYCKDLGESGDTSRHPGSMQSAQEGPRR